VPILRGGRDEGSKTTRFVLTLLASGARFARHMIAPVAIHEVNYELRPDDLFAFQWRAWQMSPAGRRARRNRYVSVVLIGLAIVVLPSWFAGYPVLTWFNALTLVVVVSITAPLAGVIERLLTRHAIREFVNREKPGKGQLGRHTVALGDDGVIETTATGETRTTWAGVDRVEDDDRYIFVYTSSMGAHVIPRRAFAGNDADEFLRVARQRTQEIAR
jgi:hypothetical protein